MNGDYFESAEVTDVGRKRKNNEDACLRIVGHGVFCVADGMGGQAGGDLASETIVTTLQEVFAKAQPEDDNTLAKRIALFRAGTNRASKWIKNFADEKVVGQMGSTIVALIIDPRNPRRAVGMHAGDSRLYRYRNGELKQITADHSAVTALAAKLGIPPEQVPAKYQNELLRAVGLSESVELEKTPVDVSSNDVFLICSDGLTKMLSDAAITKTIKDGLASGVQSVAQTLINQANEAGGKDNVTVILIKALDLANAPRSNEPDDDDKTPVPPAELIAAISPQTPVPAAESTQTIEGDEIKGDTPQTPTADSPPIKEDVKKPEPEKIADPMTPTVTEEQPTHFIRRSKKNPRKIVSDIDREAPTPTGKGFLLIIIIAALAAGGIWLAVKPKSRPPPPPVATAAPAQPVQPAVAAASPAPSTPPPAASNQTQSRQAYTEALKNAQAAWTHGNFKDAAACAATALQNLPGDAAAAKLLADAQSQLKIQDSWRNAFVNARNAFNNGDYKNTVAWANEALKYIPGERTATQLRDNAQQKLSEVAAENQKYNDALQAAQSALKSGDVATASEKAQEMLVFRPNDPKAQDIMHQSSQMMDYESAQHAFAQSDYDYALQICQNYGSADNFQQLAQQCRSEQSALNDDKNRLAAGDYSFLAALQRQPFARKPPFAKMLSQGLGEQQTLDKLQALKNSGNWQGAAAILADAGNAALINKPPFAQINQWAKSSASSLQSQRQLQQATATFEEMLVWFNIKRPNDPYIQTALARQQSRFEGQLDDKQRQQYLATIARLETVFASSGLLNQDNRAKLLKDLEETVAHHE